MEKRPVLYALFLIALGFFLSECGRAIFGTRHSDTRAESLAFSCILAAVVLCPGYGRRQQAKKGNP